MLINLKKTSFNSVLIISELNVQQSLNDGDKVQACTLVIV